jgi:hypothetical protein
LQASRYLVDSAEIRQAAELMVGEFGVDADDIVEVYTSNKWARERDWRIAAIEAKGEILCCLAEIPIQTLTGILIIHKDPCYDWFKSSF